MIGSQRRWVHIGGTAVVLIAFVLVACGGDGGGGGGGNGSGAANRPSTTARLQIVSPAPNQETGPDVKVELNLLGAQVVPETEGTLVPDKGHIHLSLDGQLVSMAYGTTQDLPRLNPGPHAIQAEFVAIDHAPFRNRVVAAVSFVSKP